MGGGSQETKQNQTSQVQKWTGKYAGLADNLIQGSNNWYASSNPKAEATAAYNNGTYSVGLNALQKADYDRNTGLMNNAQLNTIANGGNLDPSTNPYFLKSLDAKIDKSTRAFGTSLDSVFSSFQKGGTADSSMRYRKGQNMLTDQSDNVNNMVNDAYNSEYDKRVNEMMQANSLLTQAGNSGYKYQAAEQASKDSSLANYMKIYGLDAAKQEDVLRFISLLSEPTYTGTGTTTTSKTAGLGDWVSGIGTVGSWFA